MATGRFVRQSTVINIVLVQRIERRELAVTEGGLVQQIEKPAVRRAKLLLRGGQFSTVVLVIVDPFHQLWHGPIIEDGCPGVVVAKSFRTRTWFAHFLPAV